MQPVVVVDLEATCWNDRPFPCDESETIEIGAVHVSETGIVVAQFQAFIRPVRHPRLSDFCIELTAIAQAIVDESSSFSEVFSAFLEWMTVQGHASFASWGTFDAMQLRQDCRYHEIAYPFEDHLDLSNVFRKKIGGKCGHRRAMKRLGLLAEGRHHRGIDDVKNIAKMTPYLC